MGTGTDDGTSGADCITLPAPPDCFDCVAMKDKARVATKNTVARIPVERLKKFDDPVDPKTLPAEPEPKAAPMSAPLPCCKSTSTMMPMAERT